MAEIVDWTKKYAEENHKRFIRMDTTGENIPLINYYKNAGFIFWDLQSLEILTDFPDITITLK
ncbi:hypothetical protein [Chryseobacterium sp. NFX27]|uniref:hypothetical protein n=1 Tax=Chryseobacterium sp. NFX27 TaxID=2819618 RepID=UPI003CF1A050